jgi:acyl-CoA reductase-like NAD-dependent aldehyde dehydrogenase
VPGRRGDYIAPTVLQMRRPGGPVWNDELFGPIAVLSRFGSDDEALRLAADSRYGLAVGLWSRDLGRLERAWSRLDVGTIYCNSFGRRATIPLAASGRGISGYGNEHGTHGVREFLAVKSVHFPRAPRQSRLSPARPDAVEETR